MVKRPKAAGITNAVILQHLQGMRQSLEGRMDKLDGRMGSMDGRMGSMERRMDHLERDMGAVKKDIVHINDSLQRLYAHRVNMLGRIERLERTVGIA